MNVYAGFQSAFYIESNHYLRIILVVEIQGHTPTNPGLKEDSKGGL